AGVTTGGGGGGTASGGGGTASGGVSTASAGGGVTTSGGGVTTPGGGVTTSGGGAGVGLIAVAGRRRAGGGGGGGVGGPAAAGGGSCAGFHSAATWPVASAHDTVPTNRMPIVVARPTRRCRPRARASSDRITRSRVASTRSASSAPSVWRIAPS